MTSISRLARGKDNFERKRFLYNQETLDYIATLEKPKETKKNAKRLK